MQAEQSKKPKKLYRKGETQYTYSFTHLSSPVRQPAAIQLFTLLYTLCVTNTTQYYCLSVFAKKES